MTKAKHCTALNKDGTQCRAYCGLRADGSWSEFCFAHDPAKSAERDAARALGGLHGGKVLGRANILREIVEAQMDIDAIKPLEIENLEDMRRFVLGEMSVIKARRVSQRGYDQLRRWTELLLKIEAARYQVQGGAVHEPVRHAPEPASIEWLTRITRRDVDSIKDEEPALLTAGDNEKPPDELPWWDDDKNVKVTEKEEPVDESV